jgi:hypothetical protein
VERWKAAALIAGMTIGVAPSASAQRGSLSGVAQVQLVAVRYGSVGVRPSPPAGIGLALDAPIPGGAASVITRWDVDPAQVGRVELRSGSPSSALIGGRYIVSSAAPLVPQVITHDITIATPIAEQTDHLDLSPQHARGPHTIRVVVY